MRVLIDQRERRKLLAVHLCGERVLLRLESIGIRCLSDLRGKDPWELMHEINLTAEHAIWRPPLAIQALQNLVDAAERDVADTALGSRPPPTAGSSLRRHNLGFLLAKATQRWNELLYERFTAAGFADIKPSYGSLLVPLYEEDGLRIGELARRARLSKQTMTTMIRLLERNRLVQRRPDPDDRRATRIFLTPRARDFEPIAEATLLELERLTQQTLSAKATKQLATALEQLIHLDEH